MDRFYQDVLKDAGAGYWEWNIHTNTGYLSTEFKAMLGYGSKELNTPSAHWAKMIHPDDLDSIRSDYTNLIKSTTQIQIHKEIRYFHKSGRIRWMKSTGVIVKRDSKGHPEIIAGCIIDITEQKENSIALNKAKLFLDNTANTANIGNWELDLKTGTLFWDNTTKKIHGVKNNYVPSLDTALHFYKEGKDREAISKAVALAIQEGIPFDLELEIITLQKENITVRTLGYAEFKEGKCIRLYGVFQDISKQHKLKSQLKLSEEQFEATFEHTAIGMAIIDLKGNYLRTNEKFRQIVGYNSEELSKITIRDTTHPDDIENDLSNLKRILAGEINSFSVDKRYIHKSGTTVWVNLNVTLIKDTDGNPIQFIGQSVDISTLTNDKENILSLNQELEAILNAGTEVSIIATDLNGIITHYSKGAENLLGYKAEELINIFTPSILHVKEEVIQHAKYLSGKFNMKIEGFDTFIAYAKRGEHEEREWTYVKKNGTQFPVQLSVTAIKDTQGEITGFLGIAIDISKIKEAERALHESQQHLETALEGSGEGIWDLNLEAQTIYFSKQGKEILGYEENEIGDSLESFLQKVHPDDIPNIIRGYQKYIVEDESIYIKEHRILGCDNSYKWIIIRGKAIEWSEKKKPLRIMGTFYDITSRKEKEIELANALDIVSEQNKRLLNFTYIVSHNLRTHSANFELGFTLLNDEEATVEDKLEIIHQLSGVSEKLSETINNLNEVIAIQSNINKQRKKINLNTYINNTLAVLSGEIIQHQVLIENKVPVKLDINYNPAYLESILINFLTNAIKYRNPDSIPHITLSSSYDDSNSVILQIKDNGIGIDMERHGKDLFGMYKTFHRNSDAKGIGLFITKNQIEAMGGKIEVDSKVGKGTTFKIHLSDSRVFRRKAE